MSKDWYYQVMGSQLGPVSSDELKRLAEQGTVLPDTLIKKGESDSWSTAEKIKGLFPFSNRTGQSAMKERVGVPPSLSSSVDCPAAPLDINDLHALAMAEEDHHFLSPLAIRKQKSQQQSWGSEVAKAQKDVPEDEVVVNSYPMLKAMVGLYRGCAIAAGILGILAIVMAILLNLNMLAIIFSIGIVILTGWIILVLLLAAESIILFVNLADDMRVTKALLKRIAYRSDNSPPIS